MKKVNTVTCHDIWGKKKKFPVSQLKLRVSVYGLLLSGREILLAREWDGYDFPGGGIEIGESIEQSLKREFYEETGLSVSVGKFLEVHEDFFINISKKKPIHSILMYYICKNPRGKVSTEFLAGDEKKWMKKAEWLSLDRIKKIKFYNSVDSVKLIQKARGAIRA